MGQQQLLLIVLGVIVVGIAVVVGINLFNTNATESNRNAVISDLNNLAASAQAYFKKPASMGGGENSFVGYGTAIGASSPLLNTANGTYTIGSEGANSISISGTGKEKGRDGSALVKATVTVDNLGKVTTTIDN